MSEALRSDHYSNKREGVHYKILKSLPSPLRHSWLGYRYWDRVIAGDYSHFHCPPHNACGYCADHANLSRLDRVRYWVERHV